MLKPDILEDNIRKALDEYLPIAFEEAIKVIMPRNTTEVDDLCKQFGQTVADVLSEPLASSLAAAIDYYVKNISITGQIITTGSPVSQTSLISSSPIPVQNGVIPNTLKIS